MFIGHLFVFLFLTIASSCPSGMFLLDSFIQQLFVNHLACAGHCLCGSGVFTFCHGVDSAMAITSGIEMVDGDKMTQSASSLDYLEIKVSKY